MTLPDITRFLICEKCGRCERCEILRLLERLRELNLLDGIVEPDRALLVTLLDQAADSLSCISCASVGLSISNSDPHDDLTWGNEKKPARKCEACSAEIPAERIEIFPDTTMCTACQSGEERGAAPANDDVDYCPRCGNIMQLKQGARGYKMVCPSCRR